MMLRGSKKHEAFIKSIAKHFGDGRAVLSEPEHIWYFGGGYWRGKDIYGGSETPIGLRLVNPDKSPQDIAAAEKGICVIEYLEYMEA